MSDLWVVDDSWPDDDVRKPEYKPTPQETVDQLATLSKARLTSLLRLRTVRHVYDPSAAAKSTVTVDGRSVVLNKFKQSLQPYRDLDRFVTPERIMQHVIERGLLPIVTALSKDIMAARILVTGKVAAKDGEPGVSAHIEDYGVRIHLYFDPPSGDTIVAWECLYGVV